MAQVVKNEGGVTLIHHWLVNLRGGEKVLKQFSLLFPEAPIFCLITDREKVSEFGHMGDVKSSILRLLPLAQKYFRSLLFLFPLFNTSIKVPKGTKLLVSSDASLVKGVKKPHGCLHICYCHSPPRYLWELQDEYLAVSQSGFVKRLLLSFITPYLQKYDTKAATRVDYFIANSGFVAGRISSYYGREAVVIPPPVDVQDFEVGNHRASFFLIVSELVPYKRIDVAIRAFNINNKELVIIGDGPELRRLKAIANANITFLGRLPFDKMKCYYQEAKAFIFPGVEDFGITPLEAQASGTPVIAFRKGGALETVIEGKTGWFFDEQSPESLNRGIERFESSEPLDPEFCRENAMKFSPDIFRARIWEFISEKLCENQ